MTPPPPLQSLPPAFEQAFAALLSVLCFHPGQDALAQLTLQTLHGLAGLCPEFLLSDVVQQVPFRMHASLE